MNVNDQVSRELALIRRGDFNQNQLRMIYQMLRSNALGANAVEALTARQTLERATAMVRRNAEGFEPQYDPRLLEI